MTQFLKHTPFLLSCHRCGNPCFIYYFNSPFPLQHLVKCQINHTGTALPEHILKLITFFQTFRNRCFPLMRFHENKHPFHKSIIFYCKKNWKFWRIPVKLMTRTGFAPVLICTRFDVIYYMIVFFRCQDAV